MSTDATVEASALPAQFRGKVLTTSNLVIENGLYLLQVILFAGIGFAPAIVGGLMATGKLLPAMKLGFLPAAIGLALCVGLMWVLIGQLLKNPWSSLYMFHTARTEFLQRHDCVVNPNDAEAIFVEVIPRRNWAQFALQSAEDIGFVAVDAQRRQLVFEGDNKRYRIPAAAIASCTVEYMIGDPHRPAHGTPVGIVVVTFQGELGEQEFPLRPVRLVSGESLGSNYMERAHELQRRIQQLTIESIDADADSDESYEASLSVV